MRTFPIIEALPVLFSGVPNPRFPLISVARRVLQYSGVAMSFPPFVLLSPQVASWVSLALGVEKIRYYSLRQHPYGSRS